MTAIGNLRNEFMSLDIAQKRVEWLVQAKVESDRHELQVG